MAYLFFWHESFINWLNNVDSTHPVLVQSHPSDSSVILYRPTWLIAHSALSWQLDETACFHLYLAHLWDTEKPMSLGKASPYVFPCPLSAYMDCCTILIVQQFTSIWTFCNECFYYNNMSFLSWNVKSRHAFSVPYVSKGNVFFQK